MKYATHILIFLHVLIFCAVLFFTSTAQAFTWHVTNQFTISWDSPTFLSNDEPIPENNIIVNELFIAPNQDKTQKISVGETPNSQYTMTIDNEGRYLVGVRSIRNDADGNKLSESIIAWSDDPEVTATDVFGISHYFSPKPVSNMQPN